LNRPQPIEKSRFGKITLVNASYFIDVYSPLCGMWIYSRLLADKTEREALGAGSTG
jgi:hypothetical protein